MARKKPIQQKNLLLNAEALLINWQVVCCKIRMQPYKNAAENSGVIAYQIGDDFIIVEFQDGSTYLYNYKSTGKAGIEQMKMLAITGEGLTTFINQQVRTHYAEKLK